jgi:hypothetical protein
VELLVDEAPVVTRRDHEIVQVRLIGGDKELRARILSGGGTWDPATLRWRLPRGLARKLRLMNWVIAE